MIVCNVYVHDFGYAVPAFSKEMYPQKLDDFLHLLPPEIKKKFIWIGQKSYQSTNTPEKYLVRQSVTDTMVVDTIHVLKQNNVRFIDYYKPTLSCSWQNCTVEDHHHSRFVARSVAMKLIPMIHHSNLVGS